MSRLLEPCCRYSRMAGLAESQPLLTIDGVCARLALSRETVRLLVREGRLPAIQLKPGGHLRFRSEDVERLCQPTRGAAA